MFVKSVAVSLLIPLAASFGLAQHYRLEVDLVGPSRLLMLQLREERDDSERLILLDQFVERVSERQSLAWAYDQKRSIFVKRQDLPKATECSEKILALIPDDLYTMHMQLKLAESAKDSAAVAKWAARAGQLARKTLLSPPAKEPDAVESWKERVEFAAQVNDYIDYLAFVQITQTKDPRQKLAMMEEFVRRSPMSRYRSQVQSLYFSTARQIGDSARAISMAEQLLEKDPNNDELLLLLADHYYRAKTNSDKVGAYASRIVASMGRKEKPGDMTDVEWNSRKAQALGSAYWMLGNLAMTQENHAQADRTLRAALPYLHGNDELLGSSMFYIGWANYKMGNGPEALRFNRQCSTIRSSYQAQCVRNAAVVKSEFKLP